MTDSKVFEPENPLEVSLVEATVNVSHRPQFYRDILDADVFFINSLVDESHPPAPDQSRIIPKGESVLFFTMDHEGKRYIPFFSSLKRLKAYIPKTVHFTKMKTRYLFDMTKGAEFFLNPGSPYGKMFLKEEIAGLLTNTLGKMNPYVYKKETEVLLRKPDVYPKAVVSALYHLFEKTPSVEKAYVAEFFDPRRDKKPHPIIAIRTTGDWAELNASITIVLGALDPRETVDIFQMTGQKTNGSFFYEEMQTLL